MSTGELTRRVVAAAKQRGRDDVDDFAASIVLRIVSLQFSSGAQVPSAAVDDMVEYAVRCLVEAPVATTLRMQHVFARSRSVYEATDIRVQRADERAALAHRLASSAVPSVADVKSAASEYLQSITPALSRDVIESTVEAAEEWTSEDSIARVFAEGDVEYRQQMLQHWFDAYTARAIMACDLEWWEESGRLSVQVRESMDAELSALADADHKMGLVLTYAAPSADSGSTLASEYNKLRQYLAYFIELKTEADTRMAAINEHQSACKAALDGASSLEELANVGAEWCVSTDLTEDLRLFVSTRITPLRPFGLEGGHAAGEGFLLPAGLTAELLAAAEEAKTHAPPLDAVLPEMPASLSFIPPDDPSFSQIVPELAGVSPVEVAQVGAAVPGDPDLGYVVCDGRAYAISSPAAMLRLFASTQEILDGALHSVGTAPELVEIMGLEQLVPAEVTVGDDSSEPSIAVDDASSAVRSTAAGDDESASATGSAAGASSSGRDLYRPAPSSTAGATVNSASTRGAGLETSAAAPAPAPAQTLYQPPPQQYAQQVQMQAPVAPSAPTKCDMSTETPTHFVETHIDPTYQYNEWTMRRRALQLADLRTKRTHSTQTHKSHFRRENSSQAWLPKEKGVQTVKEKHMQTEKTVRYVQGLRGDPEAKVKVVTLTFDL